MKYLSFIFITLFIALTLSACNYSNSSAPVTAESPSGGDASQATPQSILARWQSGTKVLDLSRLTLNTEVSADLMLACDGSFGNNGQVNGMQRGDVMLAGSATAGYLMVGHLKYVGATDHTCSDMSKELYSYSVSGTTLTFCTMNYDVCGTYTLAP